MAADSESEIRREAAEDLRFVAGDQWDEKVKSDRLKAGKPALTFNRLPTFEQQVSNEVRQNKPSIKFSPVDNGADIDTAKVYEGMARHIQYASKADVAYETALQYSVSGSFGYFRLLTDYCHDESFDQELKFAPVLDPFSVYGIMIPTCLGLRPRYGFVVSDMEKETYKQKYGDVAPFDWEMARKTAPDWVSDTHVKVAEYHYVESKERELLLIEDGSGNSESVLSDELEGESKAALKDLISRGELKTAKRRKVSVDQVKCCLINGVGVIPDSDTEWPGKRIPVFAVLGSQKIIDGKPRLFSLVRFMRDPQILINYYKTSIAENIGITNRVPYIGYKGQFTDPRWQNANVVNYAYLEVEPTTVNGNIAPLPQRQHIEPAIQALSGAAAQEIDDLKAIAGIFDSSLGAEGNEKSGIAIQRRQAQSSITNLHFIDNLKRAQEEAGSELGVVIPVIYDTARQVRVIGEDESERVVTVNAPYEDPDTGEVKTHMLDAGRYDVAVNVGPSNATKRQETFEFIANLAQANPIILEIDGDILLRNSDAAGADEMADRHKKYIGLKYPGLVEEEGKKKVEIPPQIQSKMAQYEQIIDQLTQQLNGLAEEQKSKKHELEAKVMIEMEGLKFKREELQAKTALEQAKLASTEGVEQLWAEIEAIKHRLQAENAQQEAEASRQHATEMKAADQSHAAQMTDADRQFQAEQAAAQQNSATEA